MEWKVRDKDNTMGWSVGGEGCKKKIKPFRVYEQDRTIK